MQRALQLEPQSGWNAYGMGLVLADMQGQGAARPYFQRAMEISESHEAAMAMYCQGLLIEFGASKEAGGCTQNFIRAYPRNGEGWRQRAWFLGNSGAVEHEVQAAIDQFVRHADRDNELHRAEAAKYEQQRRVKKQSNESP